MSIISPKKWCKTWGGPRFLESQTPRNLRVGVFFHQQKSLSTFFASLFTNVHIMSLFFLLANDRFVIRSNLESKTCIIVSDVNFQSQRCQKNHPA